MTREASTLKELKKEQVKAYRPDPIFRNIGLMLVLFSCVLTYTLLNHPAETTAELILLAAVITATSALGILCIGYYTRTRVIVGEKEFTVRTLTSTKRIRWDELKSASLERLFSNYVWNLRVDTLQGDFVVKAIDFFKDSEELFKDIMWNTRRKIQVPQDIRRLY